jgi:hypothetical protein
MAYKNKTVPTKVSPNKFLDAVANERRLLTAKEQPRPLHRVFAE